MDSSKTELIADRVWRTCVDLELAVVKFITWFNHDRLHAALSYLPAVEFEANSNRPAWVEAAPAQPAPTARPARASGLSNE